MTNLRKALTSGRSQIIVITRWCEVSFHEKVTKALSKKKIIPYMHEFCAFATAMSTAKALTRSIRECVIFCRRRGSVPKDESEMFSAAVSFLGGTARFPRITILFKISEKKAQ